MEPCFVDLDVHKKTIQISIMDADGNELANKKIRNNPEDIKDCLGYIHPNSKLVIESSSVWKAAFFQIRDKLHLDVILSNPRMNRLIAESKKKTDKVDAKILADLLRGGYTIPCHVPSAQNMDNRDLVNYRYTLVRHRTGLKNSVHGILLQKSIQPSGAPFYTPWLAQVRAINDYRINAYLDIITFINDKILQSDARIRQAAKENEDATLLQSIPGVGAYTALVISCTIDGIERFVKSHKLCSYIGVVPSVRSSGNTVHYGHITHTGSNICRWVLVESVLSHVRCAPNSDISKFFIRIAKKRGTSKATVAAASKMLRMIHTMLKERREFITNYSQDTRLREHV